MSQKSTPSRSPPHSKIQKKLSTASNISVQSQKFIKHNLYDFQNDYEVVNKLGQGSFGSIFRVKHKQLKLERALKIISKKNKPQQPIPREEINSLIKLDHPNIIKIFEFYQNKDFYYIVTQLFNGRQLFDELVEDDVFTEAKAAKVSADILKAIHYMHQQGMVHRDIKAENILIKTEGEKSWIKLIDFGLGTSNNKSGLKDKIGTPQYIAPQVINGKYDQKCDVWGFGVILHTMLGGDMPFLGDSQQEVLQKVKKTKIQFSCQTWKNVSNQAKDLVSKLLERNVKNRLSASEALKHPWFKKYLSPSVQPIQLKQTLIRLKEFQLQNHLHTAAYSYINNHMSSVEQKRQLDEIFCFLDTNNNGILEFQELLSGYKTLYGESVGSLIAQEVFRKLDYNHSGSIQYNQFITYAMLKHKQIPKNHLQETFKLFDLNKDGMISTEELKKMLSNGIDDIEQCQWDAIIKGIDKNDDGEISKQEFFQCMTKISQICADTLSKTRKNDSKLLKVKTVTNSSISTRMSTRSTKSKLYESQPLGNIPQVIEIQASQQLASLI